MKKVIDSDGKVVTKAAPKITGIMPVGTNILVRLFTDDELYPPESALFVPEKAKSPLNGCPQGRVIAVGDRAKDWNIIQGSRVVLQGAYQPMPKVSGMEDDKNVYACVEPHTIKAILSEE